METITEPAGEVANTDTVQAPEEVVVIPTKEVEEERPTVELPAEPKHVKKLL